ncbi:uncharacterized protein LOC129758351 [Uranotaenia lowii]|uniref:uncharacterized protein LOC129758351 n=1 Tax=Uranotaenia lowii TaxID=190385 RepID=UPI00247AA808|nr:uncharacterized protein LOC129758351 [Uranotaenia lowii]
MKAGYWITTIFFALMMINYGDATNITHKCFQTGYDQFCLIHDVFYKRNASVRYVFPQNYSYIRIGNDGWNKGIQSVIEHLDGQLYKELGSPPMLEIMNSDMQSIEIPRQLHHGGFANNDIKWFSLEEGSETPVLQYLDLASNYISNITNVSSLVNLVHLNLISNRIISLEGHPFKPLIKLQVLYLNFNAIATFQSVDFPPSLVYISIYANVITKINYNELSFPILERLNLERNRLSSLDIPKLLSAMPKLNTLLIGANDFVHDDLRRVIDQLKHHNITHVSSMDKASCWYEEVEIDGVCADRELMKAGWLKSMLLSLVTLGMLTLIVLCTWWVLRQMGR